MTATVGCFWDLHNIFQVLAKRPPLRSPGDLLRVAFSGLCVVLYANWIKNVTHIPEIYNTYLSSCVKQISKHLIGMKIIRRERRRAAKQFCSIINWEMLLMSNNFHCAFPDSIVAAGSRQGRREGGGVWGKPIKRLNLLLSCRRDLIRHFVYGCQALLSRS